MEPSESNHCNVHLYLRIHGTRCTHHVPRYIGNQCKNIVGFKDQDKMDPISHVNKYLENQKVMLSLQREQLDCFLTRKTIRSTMQELVGAFCHDL